MHIKLNTKGRILVGATAVLALGSVTAGLFTIEPKPWDNQPEPITITTETPAPFDYENQSWTPEELLMTCDNDYEEGSDVWESCVDGILTATCMFEPFPEDSEWFTAADARCSGGRVTSDTPVITG